MVELTAVRWRRVGGVVPEPTLHRGGIARRDGLFVVVTTRSRVQGVGEASPLPGYSPDDLDAAEAAVAAWAARAPGTVVADLGAVAATIRDVGTPAARFAIETALCDALARRDGLPLHRLLAPQGPWRPVRCRELVPLDAAAIAARYATGVRDVKCKVGVDPAAEIAVLRTVRAQCPALRLQLDANGTLPPARVHALCADYAAVGVELVEEPVPGATLPAIARLAVPVALDESLQRGDRTALVRAVAATQHLAAVVVKPTVLGGLLACLDVAGVARACGAATIVTHTFDGPVAMAAAAELALALGADAAGLAPHPALAAYPAMRSPAVDGGTIRPHDRPGLGSVEGAC